MRKMFFLLMTLPSLLFAQVDSLKSKVKKNEITINALELVAGGVLPINYERFIDNNQSITLKTFVFDKHYSDFDSENSNLISLQLQYNFYLSEKKKNAGFFLAPFLKFTGGKYTQESDSYYDYILNCLVDVTYKELRVNALISGFGIGYKYLLKHKLSVGISTDIGRVLNKEGYYQIKGAAEVRIGANLGLRF